MKLLLDTHTFLWYAAGNPQLSATAAALVGDPTNDLYLSVVSAWEVAIKVGVGKLTLSAPYAILMAQALTGYGITVLAIELADCEKYETLPFPRADHRDPFDRMILVQALRRGMSIVGLDEKFDAYGVPRLW